MHFLQEKLSRRDIVRIFLKRPYSKSELTVSVPLSGYHKLFLHISPMVDTSRIIMKVPATFEGLRACRELRKGGIKTLATTIFTIEQAIAAGEAGCISISPFVHELKAGFDPTEVNPGIYSQFSHFQLTIQQV